MAEQDTSIELLAAFNPDTGAFIDLVRSDAVGLAFRDRESWEAYQPTDLSLDGAEIIEVEESFVALTDRTIAAGTVPTKAQARSHEMLEGKSR